jgi:hypothetical protein
MKLHSEDGGKKVLRNFGILLQHYTASQPKRPWLEFTPQGTTCSSDTSSEPKFLNFSPSSLVSRIYWSTLQKCSWTCSLHIARPSCMQFYVRTEHHSDRLRNVCTRCRVQTDKKHEFTRVRCHVSEELSWNPTELKTKFILPCISCPNT